jgi:hypothetical protein
MRNSRDINMLRSDVAAACRTLIELAGANGWKVLVTGTVRDDEYQLKCYKEGYSTAKTPSFHSEKAGLAFDICQNVKGHEYDNNAFWEAVSKVGKQLGFTWGGDWKSFVDKPHFQWDEHGKYTSSMIRAGNYPPIMPGYTGSVLPVVPKSILRKGSKGRDVKTLQERLNKLKFPCGSVDGVFGTRTHESVKAFQAAKGLVTDGIVGANTWAKLFS